MAPFETALILAGSVGLGLSHAFEVDHMTAVSTFVATRPRARQAVLFGLKWALGHGTSLLLFGSVLFALKYTVSATLAHWFERSVGAALLVMGIWTLWQVRKKVPAHTHGPHGHGSFLMGLLHGVAGTAAFVGETIVAVSDSYAMVVAFTLAFSVGVLVAMSAYAGLLGGLLAWTDDRSARAMRVVQTLTALGACAVGTAWILR